MNTKTQREIQQEKIYPLRLKSQDAKKIHRGRGIFLKGVLVILIVAAVSFVGFSLKSLVERNTRAGWKLSALMRERDATLEEIRQILADMYSIRFTEERRKVKYYVFRAKKKGNAAGQVEGAPE